MRYLHPRQVVRRTALRTLRHSRHLIARFRDRTDGIAAVEFALIVPIMAMMFIGAVEMSQAVTADRRVSQVASAAGDLVARVETDIQTTEVHDIAKVGGWLMAPFPAADLKITLSLVTVPCPTSGPCPTTDPPVNATNQRMRWTCEFNGASPNVINCTCPRSPYTMPQTGLIKFGDAVIVSDVEYNYKPLLFDHFMKNSFPTAGGVYKMTERLHLKTRGVCTKLNGPAPVPSGGCTCFD
jgi:Flp pilus assembly protein TadG